MPTADELLDEASPLSADDLLNSVEVDKEETPSTGTDIFPVPAFAPETPEQNKEKWINRAKNVAGTAILGPIAPSVMPWLNVISGSTKLTKEDQFKPEERVPKFSESKQPITLTEKLNPLHFAGRKIFGDEGYTAFTRELMDLPGELVEFFTSTGGKATAGLGALPVTRPFITAAFIADTMKGAVDQASAAGAGWDNMSNAEKGKTIGQMVKSTLIAGSLGKALPGQIKGALPKPVVVEPKPEVQQIPKQPTDIIGGEDLVNAVENKAETEGIITPIDRELARGAARRRVNAEVKGKEDFARLAGDREAFDQLVKGTVEDVAKAKEDKSFADLLKAPAKVTAEPDYVPSVGEQEFQRLMEAKKPVQPEPVQTKGKATTADILGKTQPTPAQVATLPLASAEVNKAGQVLRPLPKRNIMPVILGPSGKIYEGATHAIALNKAIEAGEKISPSYEAILKAEEFGTEITETPNWKSGFKKGDEVRFDEGDPSTWEYPKPEAPKLTAAEKATIQSELAELQPEETPTEKGTPNATEIRQVQESIQPERERANAQRLSAETSPSDSLQQAAGTQKVQAPRTEARQAGVLLEKPTPPSPVEPKPKEPWEMTRGEVARRANIQAKLSKELPNKPPTEYLVLKAISDKANRKPYDPALLQGQNIIQLKKTGLISGVKNLKLTEKGRNQYYDWARDQRDYDLAYGTLADNAIETAIDKHKVSIEQALREGKPVPLEVLSDYPDLKPLPPQMPAGPGAKTANVPEPDAKSQIEQLTDAFKGIDAKKIPLTQKMQEAFNIGSAKNAVQEGVAKAVSGLKATGDFLINKWRGIQTIDDLLRAKGDLSKSINERGWRVRKWEKEAKRAVPSKRWQAAIAKYIDAGGNMDKLQQGAAETKPEYRQAYLDAMNLPPDYKVAAENARSYFESRLDEAIEAGVLKDGVEDYIHRLYESRPDQANRAFAIVQQGLLSKNPALAKQRVFDFDWEAEKLGYRPVQSFITRISQYESSLSKAIAARDFIKKATELKASDGRPVIDVKGVGIPINDPEGVRQATLIKPQFNPAKANEVGTQNYRGDYVNKEFPALSKWKWVGTDAAGKPIMVQGDVAIHPEFVGRINALLEPSRVKYGRWSKYTNPMLQAGSAFKQTMLDLSGFHQVQIAVHALEHKVLPWKIIQDIDFTNPKVEGLLKGGITLGGDYHVSEGLIGSSLTRKIPMLGPLMETYHQYLFQDFIPRVKMTMALNALERNIARYKGKMTDEQIYHKTAYQANAAFGELNYIMLERSKTAQDIARLIMLAPDFLEARARFALEGFEKGGKSKVPGFGNEQRAALLLGALTMYVLARVMNKTLDDQYHFEPENAFSVVAGKHAYSLRTVQGDILHLLDKPVQFWLNRLNPLYGRTALEMATGRDYFGRQRTRLEILWDSAKNIMPISLRHGPEQSIWESLGKSFGLNARRYTATDDAFKLAKKWKDANGIGERGEFIYDSEKDPLRPLKLALSHDDEGKAAAEIKTLLESKKYTRNRLDEYFKRYASMPFTGSKANDIKWKKTLSEDERKTVEAAMQYKHEILKMYRQAFAKYYVAMKTPATP